MVLYTPNEKQDYFGRILALVAKSTGSNVNQELSFLCWNQGTYYITVALNQTNSIKSYIYCFILFFPMEHFQYVPSDLSGNSTTLFDFFFKLFLP
ncbi:hypothetical protein J2T56_003236 [Natronobacillus azotifigens]